MRSRIMIWTACFTTRLQRRGSVEREAQLKSCLNDLQPKRDCLSTGDRGFRKSIRQSFWRNAIAPLRALAFPIASLCYRIAGKTEKSAAYQKVARYWLDYIRNAPSRRRLYRRRSEEIKQNEI